MPAKNIECQLAQGQIGRYLAGANMSTEAITQLEQHIAECDDCTQFVDAKRKTLQEVSQTRQAAISVPESLSRLMEPIAAPAPEPTSEIRTAPTHALIQAIREKTNPLARETVLESAREPIAPRKRYWKALGYSAALGAILLAMAHISANPTAFFGERVGADAKSVEPAKSSAKTLAPNPPTDGDPFTAELPATKAVAGASDSAATGPVAETVKPTSATSETPSNLAPAIPEPNSISTSTPKPPRTTIRASRVRRPARNVARPAARNPRTGNSIRVYDANGNPIR